MIIVIDEKGYTFDTGKIGDIIALMYEKYGNNSFEINGKTYDFTRKSLLRITVKQFIVSFVLPFIYSMYEQEKIEYRKPNRHEDMLDYTIELIKDFLSKAYSNVVIVLEHDENNVINGLKFGKIQRDKIES
jgi:hypothetical protein